MPESVAPGTSAAAVPMPAPAPAPPATAAGRQQWQFARRPGALLAGLLLVLTGSAPLAAKQLYHYVDEHGIRHFTDVPPQTDRPVHSERIRTEPLPLFRLDSRRLDDGGSVLAVANLTGGPVEVELALAEAENIRSTPALPARFVLEANQTRELVRIAMADRYRDASYRVQAAAVPGDPRTTPEPVAYQLPLASGTRYGISQAFGGSFSHTDEQNYHAVDLGVAEGTPVLAARDGVVVQVERDFFEGGTDRESLAARANYVRVMHTDGTMAVYAHLAFESVRVQPGEIVLAGQHIGDAGATGFATGPHLHFAVQRNAGMRLVSIPFRFDGPDGPYQPRPSRRWQHAP